MNISAIFHDGSMFTSDTYHGLELQLRGDAWNPSKKPKFRDEMALRAWNWSATAVNEEARSRQFLRGLELAGILRLQKGNTDE